MPCSRKAPLCAALKAHAVASIEVKQDPGVLSHIHKALGTYSLFAVVFGGQDRCSAVCHQALARRQKSRWVRPVEAVESEAILGKLRDLATLPPP